MDEFREISPPEIDPHRPTEEQINGLLELLKNKNKKIDGVKAVLRNYEYIPMEIRLTISDRINLYQKYYKKIDYIIRTIPALITIAFQIVKLLNLLRGNKNG